MVFFLKALFDWFHDTGSKTVAIQKGSVFVLGTWRETKKSQERIEKKWRNSKKEELCLKVASKSKCMKKRIHVTVNVVYCATSVHTGQGFLPMQSFKSGRRLLDAHFKLRSGFPLKNSWVMACSIALIHVNDFNRWWLLLACVQTSPLPRKKVGRRVWGRGPSVHRLGFCQPMNCFPQIPQVRTRLQTLSYPRRSREYPHLCT